MPLHSHFEERTVVLSVRVTHNLKAIRLLAVLCTAGALAGCGASVRPDPPALSVSLSPSVVDVEISQIQQFTATIHNDTLGKGVSWNLLQSGNTCTPGCGSVSSTATNQITYSAPASV